ncbi:MAG: hypothetical protein Q7J07_10020 [Pelolinea sp.]|nr:hypothetical protein [Pelolinea sp.]
MENNISTNEKINQSLFLQAIYEGTVEIMGKPKTEQIFSSILDAKSSDEDSEKKSRIHIIANFGNEFAIRFHRNTAKGLLLRIGEASFTYLRKYNQNLIELGNIENRLKPISKRFEESLEVLAENLSELTTLKIQAFKKNDTNFCLEIVGEEMSKMLSSDLHLFYFVGLLRAFCGWLDSRKEYAFHIDEDRTGDSFGKCICMGFKDVE